MAFPKLTIAKYPLRLWTIIGEATDGKSTFAAQMTGPMLVIDSDHRFDEIVRDMAIDVFKLSNLKEDNNDPSRIFQLLEANMPGSGVRTVIVDSVTKIIKPLMTSANLDNMDDKTKNKSDAFRRKAEAMRLLQDAVTRWGTDVLFIWHLEESTFNGKKTRRESIGEIERVRLRRSINLQLEVVRERTPQGELLPRGKRGIKVIWARRGRSGMTLWDDSNCWLAMPEKIEAAVYDNLSVTEQTLLSASRPVFSGPEAAIAWGVEKGCFDDREQARLAYERLKNEQQPRSAQEMWDLWIESIENRSLEAAVFE